MYIEYIRGPETGTSFPDVCLLKLRRTFEFFDIYFYSTNYIGEHSNNHDKFHDEIPTKGRANMSQILKIEPVEHRVQLARTD